MVFTICIVAGVVLCTIHCKRASNTKNKLERELSNTKNDLERELSNTKNELERELSNTRNELERELSNTKNELERKLNDEKCTVKNLRSNVTFALDMLTLIDKQAKNDVTISSITNITIIRLKERLEDTDQPDGTITGEPNGENEDSSHGEDDPIKYYVQCIRAVNPDLANEVEKKLEENMIEYEDELKDMNKCNDSKQIYPETSV